MTLVIMAAGMGSRYGGMKQIDPVGQSGEFIVDYSVKDAIDAGFTKVIFIIKRENRALFEESVGKRIKGIKIEYAYQSLDDLPKGFSVPEGREKPWGTGHAVYSARKLIDENFAVINADDFYGKDAFAKMYDYMKDSKSGKWCMTGYRLRNTVTEHGTVSRGICETDENGFLTDINERTKIGKYGDGLAYFEDEKAFSLNPDVIVSMNCWAFTPDFMDCIENGFREFMSEKHDNPLKCEYYLPSAVKEAMSCDKCSVKVLKTNAKWYGVTYKEDKPTVIEAIHKMISDGVYPDKLWK